MDEEFAKLLFEKLGYRDDLEEYVNARQQAAFQIGSLDIAKVTTFLMKLNRAAAPPAFLPEP